MTRDPSARPARRRRRGGAAPLIVGAAALAAILSRATAAENPPEPPAATYDGQPVPRARLHETLAARVLRTDSGERMLDQFLSDHVAEREAARRGIEVSEAEVDATLLDAARRAAVETGRDPDDDPMGALEKVLAEKGASLADLRSRSRAWVTLQRMAREDLGAKGEVSGGQIDLWLRDLKRRSGVTTGPGLDPRQVARVGGEPVSAERFGRWLVGQSPRGEVLGAVYDLAFHVAVESRAARDGVALREEDVTAEIARLERQFRDQPDVEGSGVDFASWVLRARGMTMDEFRRDADFRTGILARRVMATTVTEDDLHRWWEDRAALYGPRARVRRILIRGEAGESRFGATTRPMAEARRLAARAADEVRAGRPFEDVARRFSEDPEPARGRRMDLGPTMANAIVPQPVLDVIFAGEGLGLVGPVEAVDGVHLVHVERRTPAPTFEEAVERVRLDVVAHRVLSWKLALREDPLLAIAPDLVGK